jgi:hypothetical protein
MPYLRRRNRRFADAGADYSTEVAGSNYERHYGLPNVFIGGNWAHGVARGNNHVLSKPPDWHDLLNRNDEKQQLASFVHDYQLATAKNWYGVRWAHRNYAQNMSRNVHPMGPNFFYELSQPGRARVAGFIPHNLKPSYGIPERVWQDLNIGDEGRQSDHFNHYVSTEQFGDNVDGIAENFGDNFFGDSALSILHMDHKNMNSAVKNFGDTRKQATTNVQVGSGSSLHSVPSVLEAFYKGARTLSTTWHHSGTSAMNNRTVFTYAFRHTLKTPWIGANIDTHYDREFVLSPSTVIQKVPLTFTDAGGLVIDISGSLGSFEAPSSHAPPDQVIDVIPIELNPNSWDGDIPVQVVIINAGAANESNFTQDPNVKDYFKIRYFEELNKSPSHLLNKPAAEKFHWINVATGKSTKEVELSDLDAQDQAASANAKAGQYNIVLDPANPNQTTLVKLPDVSSKDYRLGFYRQVVKSGVNVISPERPVLNHSHPFSEKVDGKSVLFNNTTWYSPFCLQELETLSWNLNRMKLLPTPKGNYVLGTLSNLPGRLKKDCILSADDFVNDHADLIDPDFRSNLSNAFGVYKDVLYDPTSKTVSPLCEIGRRYGKTSFQDSKAKAFLPRDDPSSEIKIFETKKDTSVADFKAQLGKSEMTFTFVNTGDTTMIVDAVVHRGKDQMCVGVNAPTVGDDDVPIPLADHHLDLTHQLLVPYCNNYIAYHKANQTRKVSDEVPVALDVLYDPDTKFVPTSYRLPKAGNGVSGVIDVDGKQVASNETVGFIDIARRKIIVLPNSRKTVRFIIPTKSYLPCDCDYTGLINDESVAITFGVTGKTTKVVADTEGDKLASQAVGRTAAPTSFHIIGSETQQVYPCAIQEFVEYYKQIYKLPDPELAKGQDASKQLHSAVYIGPNLRDIKSRYAHLMIDDGTMTRGQAAQEDAADAADLAMDLDDILEADVDANGNAIIGSDTGRTRKRIRTDAGENTTNAAGAGAQAVVIEGINMDSDPTVLENVMSTTNSSIALVISNAMTVNASSVLFHNGNQNNTTRTVSNFGVDNIKAQIVAAYIANSSVIDVTLTQTDGGVPFVARRGVNWSI